MCEHPMWGGGALKNSYSLKWLVPTSMFPSLQLLESNDLPSSTVTFLERSHAELTADDFKGHSVDAIIGEPYFSSSLLPWHNLHFWYAISSLRKIFAPETEGCVVLPGKGFLKGVAGM